MGRSVMVSCAVKEYLEGENVWKEALARQRGKENWLEEITGVQEGEGEKDEDDVDEEGSKAKKRKRHKKEKKSKRSKSE